MPDLRWIETPSGDVRLAVHHLGGAGARLLLLHGLAGHGGEWSKVTNIIARSHEVLVLDLRGHGASDRHPIDVSPAAFCSDVAAIIQATGDGPLRLVGQSFGGHVAFVTAAQHPELVSSLVVIEADPEPTNPRCDDQLVSWLRSWPRPFPDRETALSFFAAMSTDPAIWLNGLERRTDGYWPRFDVEVILKALAAVNARSWWDEWTKIACPTLVVRGDRGSLPEGRAHTMAQSVANAKVVTIADAGHDVHIDQSERLAELLEMG